MGYSLNQRGLYAGVIRNPSDKRQKLDNGRWEHHLTLRTFLPVLELPMKRMILTRALRSAYCVGERAGDSGYFRCVCLLPRSNV